MAEEEFESGKLQSCPECGTTMSGIKGSKCAICSNCGYKDSCCY